MYDEEEVLREIMKRWRVAGDTRTVARGHLIAGLKNAASSKSFSQQPTMSLARHSQGFDL
jgi:hypothetical protein